MGGRRLLGVLRQPSWIALTLLVVVLGVTFVELGLWQLRRHDERAAANAVLAANLDAAPVALDELAEPGRPVPVGEEWRPVTITGTYDVEHELLVRNRTYEGALGYEVLTPLVPASGPAVLVLRGWVPSGETATATPEVPRPPAGVVTVDGRLRRSATGGTEQAGLPTGQVRRVDTAEIAAGLPYAAVDTGYVQLVPGAPGSDQGSTGPRALPAPEIGSGPHRPYAVQWFLFAVIAVVGWFVLLRSAAREGQPARREPAGPARTGDLVERR